jgi:hypothetical protein
MQDISVNLLLAEIYKKFKDIKQTWNEQSKAIYGLLKGLDGKC